MSRWGGFDAGACPEVGRATEELLAEGGLLLNPRLAPEELLRAEGWVAERLAPPGLVWIRTSGSSGRPRLVGLAPEALRLSAEAVCAHLGVTEADTWLLALPTFHVGGLSVLVRALLSGARVVRPFLERSWSAEEFLSVASSTGASLSSLVPAQVFDLVRLGATCPDSMRAIVVGGDSLPEELYARARRLRFPLLPSYGLTECSSQVATASICSLDGEAREETPDPEEWTGLRGAPLSPRLLLLRHVRVRQDRRGHLWLQSGALLSGYLEQSEEDEGVRFVDPRVFGWLDTGDLGEVAGEALVVHGRAGDLVQVGGELVALAPLRARLEKARRLLCPRGDAALFARADPRLGHRLWLVTDTRVTPGQAAELRRAHDGECMPYERVAGVLQVPEIPRTELGKVRLGVLKDLSSQGKT